MARFGLSAGIAIATLFAGVLASGCATTEDPHEGGFVSGAVNLTTGRYQERVQEKESELERVTDEQRQLMQEADGIRQERARLDQALKDAATRLGKLEASLDERRRALETARHLKAEDEKTLRNLEAKLVAVRAHLNDMHSRDLPVSKLRWEAKELREELDEMDKMVELLGGAAM